MWPFKKRERLPLLRMLHHLPDSEFLLKFNTMRICDLCGQVMWNFHASSSEQQSIPHDACPIATVAQHVRASQVAVHSKWSYCLG